jgi:hypothetical protein
VLSKALAISMNLAGFPSLLPRTRGARPARVTAIDTSIFTNEMLVTFSHKGSAINQGQRFLAVTATPANT